nr:uncharacterized protein LOC118967835 [Manis javanica]
MPSNRGCTGHLLDTAVPTPPPTSLIDGFSTLPGCSGRTTPHHESPGVGYVAVPSGGCSPWAKNPHPEQQVAAGRTFVSVRAGFSSLYLNRQGTRLRRLPQGEQRAWKLAGSWVFVRAAGRPASLGGAGGRRCAAGRGREGAAARTSCAAPARPRRGGWKRASRRPHGSGPPASLDAPGPAVRLPAAFMDAALKRSRSEEPAELVLSARGAEAAAEEGMEQGLEEEEEEVDPRIQGELEKLNQSTDDINRRETELERVPEASTPASCRLVRWISASSSNLSLPLALLEQHHIPFAL